MRFKKGMLTSTLLVTLLAFTGCSSSGGDSASDKVELRYAIWDQSHKEAIETLAEQYEEENPNVDIRIEALSYSDYWTKMETSSAGGSAPDIFWMNAVNMNKYAENEMIVNMDEHIKEKNLDMSQYLDGLTTMYNYKGSQYAVPSFWDDQVMMINTRLMKEYNISEPKENWNWDEMITWLEEAKSKLPEDIYPMTSYVIGSNQAGVYNEVASAGGKIISEDRKQAMLTSPETKVGFEKYVELTKSDLHSPHDVTLEVGNTTLFKSEKALAIQAGSYALLPFCDEEQSQVAGNFKIYPIPTIKDGNKTKSIIHGLGNVISANSKYQEEAFDFIQFMSTEESMKKYTELALVPQAHKNVQDFFVEMMKEKTGIDASVISDVALDAMPYPCSFETAKWEKVITDYMSKIMLNEITVEEALENAQMEMQAILDKEPK